MIAAKPNAVRGRKMDHWASGVLVKGRHDRLVANMANYAADAGITEPWISTSMKGYLTEEEIEWAVKFDHHAAEHKAGLIYIGTDPKPIIEDRMSVMTGFFVRNFRRARLMTVNQVFDRAKDGELAPYTVLLIPNFFIPKSQGGNQPDWRVQLLYDTLLERYQDGRQTVLYATSMTDLGKEYGTVFRNHIDAHYERIQV